MESKKVIRIGLDFDGVVTYNPMRVLRLVVSFTKHKIIKVKKLGFFKPKSSWQRWIYYLGIVAPSFYPARGVRLLKKMANIPKYEFYLITGRYGFTKYLTHNWLKKYQLLEVFKKIYLNENDEQPHKFKLRIINQHHFDFLVEDNFDIVRDLNEQGAKTRILWIYNILESWRNYPDRFPHLERALEKINESNV